MRHSIVRTLLISAAAAGLMAGVGACSCSIGAGGPKAVSKSDIADQITAKMTDAAGNKPSSVTCPGDLPAKVGAQVNCEMKVKDQNFNVNVTVTSVNGSKVNFDMVETVDKNQVARTISDKLTQQVGVRPDEISCPDNLKGVTGATLRCQLVDGAKKYGVNVTVTNVEAGDVKFDFKVDDEPS
jgi:mRNA-degrading endonuclease toxin of MazEF toxin-antitoxin module